MRFTNLIFPELHNWAFVTGLCAVLLIVGTIIFLIVNLILRKNAQWQIVLCLFIIGIGIWSLSVAINEYQQWLSFVSHLPAHGYFIYTRAINENYLADIFRCQIQFAVVVVFVAMLFILYWVRLLRFHGIGEKKSDTLSA